MTNCDYSKKPIFFEKNRVFRVYTGGKLFSEFFGDDSEDSFYPEEWICSSTKALNEGSTDEFEGVSKVKGTNIYFNELINYSVAYYLCLYYYIYKFLPQLIFEIIFIFLKNELLYDNNIL
jgi:hypothetical protein